MAQFFNSNVFVIGIFIVSLLYIGNIVNAILIYLAKVEIESYGMFFSPFFSIHSKTIKKVKFTLGWIPLGSYVGFKSLHNEVVYNDAKLNKEKAKYEKPWFSAIENFNYVQFLIYLLSFFVTAIIFFKPGNLSVGLHALYNYICEFLYLMFYKNEDKERLMTMTREMLNGKNVILFSCMILSFVMFVLSPINIINSWISNHKNEKIHYANWIILPAVYWLILWKIPRFIFSFFSFSQSLSYFFSLLAGLYLSGIICYFGTFYVVKLFLRSK